MADWSHDLMMGFLLIFESIYVGSRHRTVVDRGKG